MNTLEFPEIIQKLTEMALSEPGKLLCKNLKPETDETMITLHLLETSEAKTLLQKGGIPLSNLLGMDKVMEKLGKTVNLNPEELSLIRSMNRNVGRMMRFMVDRSQLAPTITTYAASMDELKYLSDEIDRCIVDQRVDDKASPELSRLRKKIAIIMDRIRNKLDSIMNASGTRDLLQDQLVGMRDNHYVIPVKREHRQKIDGHVLDISSTGSTVFIEPAAIRALKMELDLNRLDEEQEVYRILSTLTGIAESAKRELKINLETMTQYDFLFAKAKLSNEMKAICPILSRKGQIKIHRGRHPLIGTSVVPLDFHIGDQFRALIITGPNTGGKTVVLKTVGLFTIMTQSGLHIPAEEGSTIAIFDDVLVDIGDGQSIAQSLSTFSSHIKNIISILACANSRTLVIIDELGTGTDPGEGMGLAVSVMEELYKKGATLLATTHYSEIKEFAATKPGFRNGCMGFNIETLQPKYELSIGIPGESNAFLISLRLGMPAALVERAHQITYHEYKDYRHTHTANTSRNDNIIKPVNSSYDMGSKGSSPNNGHDTTSITESHLHKDDPIDSKPITQTQYHESMNAITKSKYHENMDTITKSKYQENTNNTLQSHQQKNVDTNKTFPPKLMQDIEPFIHQEILNSNFEEMEKNKARTKARKELEKEKLRMSSPYKLGDCVFVTSMNRTGIVCDTENSRGEIGVSVLHKKIMVKHDRIRPFIDGKDLYPEDYNLDIVFESKENRKKRHQMGKRHIDGLEIVTSTKPDR